MKAIKCEMCGSNDVVKQEDLFVCQNCGTKYSVEAARKMMIEGTVDVQGTVRIDDSSELANLFELARRSKKTNNANSAYRYYNQIVVKKPSSWEASFYSLYYEAYLCKTEDIKIITNSFRNSLPLIFQLLLDEVAKEEMAAVNMELTSSIVKLSEELYAKAQAHYKSELKVKKAKKEGVKSCYVEFEQNVLPLVDLIYDFGDQLVSHFGEKYGAISSKVWVESNKVFCQLLSSEPKGVIVGVKAKKAMKRRIKSYTTKIRQYDPSYKEPKKRNGCYVATAVYGSYNCPEVWTLRRFRDNTLDTTWYGRVFIKTYYAISPTLVKWFGETQWFKKLWRKPLDRMVSSLQRKGVESTPYQDKY